MKVSAQDAGKAPVTDQPSSGTNIPMPMPAPAPASAASTSESEENHVSKTIKFWSDES